VQLLGTLLSTAVRQCSTPFICLCFWQCIILELYCSSPWCNSPGFEPAFTKIVHDMLPLHLMNVYRCHLAVWLGARAQVRLKCREGTYEMTAKMTPIQNIVHKKQSKFWGSHWTTYQVCYCVTIALLCYLCLFWMNICCRFETTVFPTFVKPCMWYFY